MNFINNELFERALSWFLNKTILDRTLFTYDIFCWCNQTIKLKWLINFTNDELFNRTKLLLDETMFERFIYLPTKLQITNTVFY